MFIAPSVVLVASMALARIGPADDDMELVRAALEAYCTSIDTLELRVQRTYSDQETEPQSSEYFLALKGKRIFHEEYAHPDERVKRSFWFFDGERQTGVRQLGAVPSVGFTEFKEEKFYNNEHPVWFLGLYLRAPRRIPVFQCLSPTERPAGVVCEVTKSIVGGSEVFLLSVRYQRSEATDYFSRFTYKLDPARSFLPMEITVDAPDRKNGGTVRLETWRVLQFAEVVDPSQSELRWFPERVLGTGQINRTKWNCEYKYVDVKVNQPFEESLFTYSIPQGAHVIDHVNNTSYVQGGLEAISKGLDETTIEGVKLSRNTVELDARPRFYSTWLAIAVALVSSVTLIVILFRRYALK
jgi:hypothetical protein